ncbi:hypothetical protein GCM10011610_42480 [Nocardia rhizosphaerihabitans]|uniref:Uncharacterized protein n=1 Tax=Nocardia rhizosphaerihabitans TaxID=1691570 RepID=A0ABQ2KL71_9NOCA|nr:hypothetical protein GCM10011610_42480 [Nocardia rhizosphaerihabitans]
MTPVIRCSAHDHMPGSPRYRLFRFGWAGAGASIVVIECGASNVVDGPGHRSDAGMRGEANAQVAALCSRALARRREPEPIFG